MSARSAQREWVLHHVHDGIMAREQSRSALYTPRMGAVSGIAHGPLPSVRQSRIVVRYVEILGRSSMLSSGSRPLSVLWVVSMTVRCTRGPGGFRTAP